MGKFAVVFIVAVLVLAELSAANAQSLNDCLRVCDDGRDAILVSY